MKAFEQIKTRVAQAVQNSTPDEFIYELLRAYGLPKASVTRLEKGAYNLAKRTGEVLWKKRVFFSQAPTERLRTTAEEVKARADVRKHEPRFVVLTDFQTLLAHDLKTGDSLETPFSDLPKRYDFFLPWAGVEKAEAFHENPADIKAAEKMALFYDEIIKANPDLADGSHELNVFFARILFCLFAEDTGIFEKDAFSNALATATSEHGEDVSEFLDRLFAILNTRDRADDTPFYLRDFPYVNGGLFDERVRVPTFSRKARRTLLECGSELDWSEINPDIFGSMVQAVVHQDQRAGLGVHYTSVPNIMKVIRPLFLDDLRIEFERSKGSQAKLRALLNRLSRIKYFDPACGSGNFLIIAYKEIRKLEMEIIAELERIAGGQGELYLSQISLDQFYGIEVDDFAHEVAMLSLWLAAHQMNVLFQERFGRVRPYLPLKEAGRIVCGNAARLDWKEICPVGKDDEVYLMGNPPYVGAQTQSVEQKRDLDAALGDLPDRRRLDYIAIWFVKAARYLRGSRACRAAFVSTSSVTQGQQVAYLWPHVLSDGVEIAFAHRPFKWENNAKDNAAVSVVVIGLRNQSAAPRWIYDNGLRVQAAHINPYLVDGPDVIVSRRSTLLSPLPKMVYGNMPIDYGHLILSDQERRQLLDGWPHAAPLIRRLLGADELVNGESRWCLWIEDDQLEAALQIPPVRERIALVREKRAASSRASTRKAAKAPHQFDIRNMTSPGKLSIVVPRHGSERREYVPIALVSDATVVHDSACVIYDADLWVFAAISSRMHMTWVRAVAGRLKMDYRYSATICYNTFPFPALAEPQKVSLEEAARAVIIAREKHPEKTLSELYDPDLMPDNLRAAHQALDLAVDACYQDTPFHTDEERLKVLLEMYHMMTRTEDE